MRNKCSQRKSGDTLKTPSFSIYSPPPPSHNNGDCLIKKQSRAAALSCFNGVFAGYGRFFSKIFLTFLFLLFSTGTARAVQQQLVTEFQKACEVCPYADADMCRGWVPDCKDEPIQLQCKFTTLAMCNNSCSSGTCSRNTSTGCYDCNITTTSCTYSSASACVSGSKGCSSCAKGNDGCYHCSACSSGYYRTVELTTIDGTKTFLCTACPANGTCNGTSVTCKAGYELRDPEGVHLVGTKECVEVLMPVKDGACPAGTTLSDDKCCCLNN